MPETIITGGIGPISDPENMNTVMLYLLDHIPQDIIDLGVKHNEDGGYTLQMSVALHIDTPLKPFASGGDAIKELLENARRMAVALRAGATQIDRHQGVGLREVSGDADAEEGTPAPGEESSSTSPTIWTPDQPTSSGGPRDEKPERESGSLGPPRKG